MIAGITLVREDSLSLADFRRVLDRSGLAERRPKDGPRLQAMLDGADFIVTARDADGAIVGVARNITDWSYSSIALSWPSTRPSRAAVSAKPSSPKPRGWRPVSPPIFCCRHRRR